MQLILYAIYRDRSSKEAMANKTSFDGGKEASKEGTAAHGPLEVDI